MKARVFSAILVLLLAVPGMVRADVLNLPGPNLDNSIKGWSRLGLRVTALKDVVLEQFVFNNQGLPDVISLEDGAGKVVGEYQYSGGEPLHLVRVEWPLTAGTSYLLISQNGNNGKWAPFSGYPVLNDHVQVDAAVGNGGLFASWWFNFTDLQTQTVASALTVAIDVKPFGPESPVNLKSRGKIPVAIYSDEDFDATTVLPASIQMAGAGVAVMKNGQLMAKQVDVNEDGLVDLLVMFKTTELVPELLLDGVAILTAVTSDQFTIEGTDHVVIVPKSKKSRR